LDRGPSTSRSHGHTPQRELCLSKWLNDAVKSRENGWISSAGDRPISLGQASRISGVTPADISVLMIHLHARRQKSSASG